MNITYDEFIKVDISAGKIQRVEDFPRARNPSYKLWVDFGNNIGELATSAQITGYKKEELIGKRVLRAVNLGERNIAGFKSQFLIFGLPDTYGVIRFSFL